MASHASYKVLYHNVTVSTASTLAIQLNYVNLMRMRGMPTKPFRNARRTIFFSLLMETRYQRYSGLWPAFFTTQDVNVVICTTLIKLVIDCNFQLTRLLLESATIETFNRLKPVSHAQLDNFEIAHITLYLCYQMVGEDAKIKERNRTRSFSKQIWWIGVLGQIGAICDHTDIVQSVCLFWMLYYVIDI